MHQLPNHVFKNDDDYYECLGDDIWLMDNHKWSFLIWNRECDLDRSYLLMHIDYHWDAGYDFWDSSEDEEMLFSSTDEEIVDIVKEENLIRFDSFICPAIAKGFVDEVHFFCLQGDDDGSEAIYEEFLEKFKCEQVLHDSIDSLSQLETGKPILFDFCIDVFNKSSEYYGSDIWPEIEIDKFLDTCKLLVVSADIVTISMSYGYSGSAEDTEYLTRKVVSKFSEWRENS